MSEPEKSVEIINEEQLERLIEEKVEKKTQKLERQNQKLKKEIQALKSGSNKFSRTDTKASQNQGISRRQFLKKAGLGTAGLAALMSPVSALNVDSNSFSVRTGSDLEGLEEYFSVGENGPVNIKGTDLLLNGNDIDDIRNLGSAEGQYINLKNNSISLNFSNDEVVRFYNYDTENTVLETSGDNVKIPNGNLSIAEGRSINSGGSERINFASTRTNFRDDNGVWKLELKSDDKVALKAQSGEVVRIDDEVSGDVGVEYTPGSSAGLLRTPNAGLVVEDRASAYPSNEGLNFSHTSSLSSIRARSGGGNSTLSLEGEQVNIASFGGLIDTTAEGTQSANLRLATGQAIEDGDGTDRVSFDSNGTFIGDENGSFAAIAGRSDVGGGYIGKGNGGGRLVRDNEGVFDAIRYTTNSSIGTLELTNAFLSIVSGDTFSGVSNTGIGFGAAGGGESLRLTFEDGNSNHATLYAENGDLIAEDVNGNKTTLT